MNRYPLSLISSAVVLLPASLVAQGYSHGTYFTAPYGPAGTWNLYMTVSAPMTWTDAQAFAAGTKDPLGKTDKPGHLVTIGSAPENMFVYQKVQGRYIWIGLTDSEKYGGKEAGDNRDGGWRWVTGEPYTFKQWRSIEPNEGEATGEDGVALEHSSRWSDWPIGADGQTEVMHPSMVEWETNSPQPVTGALPILPVLPKKWSVDPSAWKGEVQGEGSWSLVSVVGMDARGIDTVVAGMQREMPLQATAYRTERLNYNIDAGPLRAGGWVAITDHPKFPFIMGPCGALHVAKVKLEKAGTWSFNMHCDDFSAIRFPGHKWKSVSGLGGIDPQDAETMYYECESGDGCMIGVIDLPAGESTVEVLLGNRIFDGMIQLLAAPGEFALEGATDQWRFPGHKAAGELAWPGVGSGGWKVTRKDNPAGAKPLEKLMDGMAIGEDVPGVTAEGVEKINYIDSGAVGETEFPNPVEFPGDKPGGQDQFLVMAQADLVIPRDGVYHIGIHADNRCALRIADQKWTRSVRDTSYVGKLEGDTLYGEDPMHMGTNVQLFGEMKLKQGTYKMEVIYVNFKCPSALSVFGAPAGYAPRLLVKDGAKIEPDIDGLPLITPEK